MAQRLLETTDRAFQLVVSEGWLAALLRTKSSPASPRPRCGSSRSRRFAFRTISQIGISYPDSALSQALSGLPKGAPEAGDRFPWLRLSGRRRPRISIANWTTPASTCW